MLHLCLVGDVQSKETKTVQLIVRSHVVARHDLRNPVFTNEEEIYCASKLLDYYFATWCEAHTLCSWSANGGVPARGIPSTSRSKSSWTLLFTSKSSDLSTISALRRNCRHLHHAVTTDIRRQSPRTPPTIPATSAVVDCCWFLDDTTAETVEGGGDVTMMGKYVVVVTGVKLACEGFARDMTTKEWFPSYLKEWTRSKKTGKP